MATETRETGLIYTVWEITLQCDLSCGHCGSRAGKKRSDELSTAEALDVIEQIADMGCREVTLIGGEAYLREDWPDLIRAIKARDMLCSTTTGGRGLTPERIARAKAAGLDSVSVSLDGLEATHNRQRGVKDAWERATTTIKNLRAAGIPTAVNTQVNRLSYGELDGLLDLLIEWGIYAWQVQFTVPMGRAADNWTWLLQPDDLLEAMPKLAELYGRGLEGGVRMWPGNNVGYFGPHESTFRGRSRLGHTRGCTAGMHTLGLEADGKIKGCPSLTSWPYTGGNVREKSIREVWDTSEELRFTRDKTTELWGYCQSCYYADICRAGCTWTAHVFFNKAGNNPYCHHRALEHQSQGLRERFVRIEAAPGDPFDNGEFKLVVEPVNPDKAPLDSGLDRLLESDPLPDIKPRQRRTLPVVYGVAP